jgi:hypothetical protein
MPVIQGKYYTEEEVTAIENQSSSSEFDKFLLSGIVGAVTGSTLIGGLVGGSLLGGFVGDLLEGDDDSWF